MFFKRGVVGAVMLLALISLNCFKEPLAPVAPTWDTDMTVPLANRVYTISEIIARDTSLLKAGAGSQVSVSKAVTLQPTFVDDKISLSPKDTAVQMQLGAFEVTAPEQRMPIDVNFIPKGYTIPVPDTTVTFADLETSIATFEEITLKSGSISLQIENKLPVPMDLLVPIRLLDRLGNTIATFTFSPARIPPNSSRTATDNLAQKTFESDFRITGLEFYTPGSAFPVPIPNGDLLVATLSTSNLRATRAELTSIPAQHLADRDTAKLRIDDSTLVREVHFRSGSLRFAFTNNIALGMTFKFRFSELQRRVGSAYIPFEDSLYLGPNGTGSMILNLANTRVKSPNGSLLSALSVLSSVSIPASSGQSVVVSETDRVSISVTKHSATVVDSAVGVLRPTWVNVDTKVGVNLGAAGQKYSGQLNLPAANLSLKTSSSIGFPSDVYMRLGAKKNAQGDSVFLDIPASQRRLTPGNDAITFDPAEVGRFFSQITGKLPDSIRIVGRMLVNPPDVYVPSVAGVGTVGSNSSVSGSISVDVPMTLGIVSAVVRDTLALGDTTGDGKKDFIVDKTQRYNKGRMFIEIENGLPVGLTVNVGLMNRLRQTLLSIPQSGSPLVYAPAQVDGNGYVTAAAKSRTFIELNKQELEQWDPAELISYGVTANTPGNGPPVRFRTTDNVRIRLWTQLSVKVN